MTPSQELSWSSDNSLGTKTTGSPSVRTQASTAVARLVITNSETGTKDEQTKASWRVDDVAAEVGELRSRGVEIVDYDEPWLKTVDGVADVGFALSAWFTDPFGNTIGLLEFKDGGSNAH